MRSLHRCAALVWLVLWSSCPAGVGPVKIGDFGKVARPAGWQQKPRGPTVELIRPKVGQKGIDAIIHVRIENRTSHEEALRRLAEIAAGWKTPVTFLDIGGWPALQRRRTARAPMTGESKRD